MLTNQEYKDLQAIYSQRYALSELKTLDDLVQKGYVKQNRFDRPNITKKGSTIFIEARDKVLQKIEDERQLKG